MKPVSVVRFLVFYDLAPEQETEIHFSTNDHLVNIIPALQINDHKKAVALLMVKERIAKAEGISLKSYIRYLQCIMRPLFKTKGKIPRRIAELAITIFEQPHGSKGHTFSTLYIQDNAAQYLCLGPYTDGNEE